MTNVLKKMSSTLVPPKDDRGNKVPGNKIPEAKDQMIKEHINSFQKYTSHYSRKKFSHKKYLDPRVNITKMYELYREFCAEKNEPPVKESYYMFIFNTAFNLSFHKPCTDSCATCDRLENLLVHGDPHEVQTLTLQKELHLRKAEAARDAKNRAKEYSKNDPNHNVSFCFDLQKTLATPLLTCSKAYYARQL